MEVEASAMSAARPATEASVKILKDQGEQLQAVTAKILDTVEESTARLEGQTGQTLNVKA